MSLDLTTLRLIKYRNRYEKLAGAIPKRALDRRMQVVLADFGRYFRELPDAQKIEAEPFGLFFKTVHPNVKPEEHATYSELFHRIEAEDVSPELEAGLMKRLMETATAYDVATLIEKFNSGEEVDIRLGLMGYLEEYDKTVDRKVKNPQILTPIEDLLAEDESEWGFNWRLDCLNQYFKPLIPGDFVVVAARPNRGKTSFLADQATFLAAQVDALYPDERRSILWFNNEGPGKRIVTRCFQAALGCTTEDLAKYAKKGTIRDQYRAALGGRGGTLRIFDIHEWWSHEVEELIQQHRPAGIIFDMVDNIRFGGDLANNGERNDQVLEAMYQWARIRGVKYDCWVMATSQISSDGDGQQYPAQSMLKDSKTGKQGAADMIITVGASNDPMLSELRYIGCTKAKRRRTGMGDGPHQPVVFDSDHCRFKEVQG